MTAPNIVGLSSRDRLSPAYFIVRTSGLIVPMIAVDELPPYISLVNAPRSIDIKFTKGMLNLGMLRSNAGHYKLVEPSEGHVAGTSNQAVDIKSLVRSAPMKSQRRPESDTDSESSFVHPISAPPQSRVSANITAHSRPQHQRSRSPVAVPSTLDRSTLCRHWCTHGVCKWGQQCRYRHTMPMTLVGLHEVGLRDWPGWYKNLNPGYFVEPQQQRGVLGGDRGGTGREQIGKARERLKERDTGERCVTGGGGRGGIIGKGSGIGNGNGNEKRGCCSEREKDGRARRIVRAVREKASGGSVGDGEDLGEQLMKRLRGLERSERESSGRVEIVEKENEGNAAIERAAVKDVRKWEDDEESEVEEIEQKEAEMKSGKLVDV